MPRGRFVNRPYENLTYQGLRACLFDGRTATATVIRSNVLRETAGCYSNDEIISYTIRGLHFRKLGTFRGFFFQ